VSPTRTIVIVGAGFSGTLVAANLLRSQSGAATRIVLIERSNCFARGKAYADSAHPFLLNVPAGRMSADPRRPLDFLDFARRQYPSATVEDFLPRALYGEYLESVLLDAEVSAPAHMRLERRRADACGIEPIDGGTQYRVQLSDGDSLIADDVTLALGNPPPAELPGTDALHESCYIPDPWSSPLHFRPGESILLIGTGLTMVDVALAAATPPTTPPTTASVDRTTIHCISRHGLLPASQTPFSPTSFKGDRTALLRAASFSALTLFRGVRELVDETERSGNDWREAITFIRSIAPALWQRLPLREKRRILRHVRPYWDVHRHRLAAETLAKLQQMRRRDQLHVHAGRLLTFERIGAQVRVTWRPRGESQARTLIVDRVVNCTGPDYNARRSRDPLVRSLLAQGLASTDSLKPGIRTGACGALIDSRGRTAPNLFYVGPLLRADHWEVTAAQELRGHAERLAGLLVAAAGGGVHAGPPGRVQAVSGGRVQTTVPSGQTRAGRRYGE